MTTIGNSHPFFAPAPILLRILALILDLAILGVIYTLLILASVLISMLGFGPLVFLFYVAWFTAPLLYFGIQDGSGGTPGKRALGLQVISQNGATPGFGSGLVRFLLQIVDAVPGYLVGFVTIASTEYQRRVGDIVAGTIVVQQIPNPITCDKCRNQTGGSFGFCDTCGTDLAAPADRSRTDRDLNRFGFPGSPVRLSAVYPQRIDKSQVLKNLVAALFLYLSLWFFAGAAFYVAIIDVFAILVKGRVPKAHFLFVRQYLATFVRVFAFFPALASGRSLTGDVASARDFPIRLEVDPPHDLSRSIALGLKLPAHLLGSVTMLSLAGLGVLVLTSVPVWFAIVITESVPRWLLRFNTGLIHWIASISAWELMIHDRAVLFGSTRSIQIVAVVGLLATSFVGASSYFASISSASVPVVSDVGNLLKVEIELPESHHLTPQPVYGLGEGVVDIAAASSHSCAIHEGGGISCWGNNLNGRFMDGTSGEKTKPVEAQGIEAVAVRFSENAGCFISDDGKYICMGPEGPYDLSPDVPVHGISTASSQYRANCAIDPDGAVICRDSHVLGGPQKWSRREQIEDAVTFLTGTHDHACAITEFKRVICWGINSSGQLGIGAPDRTYSSSEPIIPAIGLPEMQTVSTGRWSTCGVSESGGAYCWGEIDPGGRGHGTRVDSPSPVLVPGLESGVRQVSVGYRHGCAVMWGGQVKCWGLNDKGQLGDGTQVSSPIPVDVSGLSEPAKKVVVGGRHSCVLTESGAVYCWGNDEQGQVGN